MLAINMPPSAPPCRSCGAYGGSQHGFSCQPGKHIQQGHMPRAPRDERLSALVRVQLELQDALIAGL